MKNGNMDNPNQTRYTLLQRACDLHDESAWEEFVGHYRRFIFYILRELGVADRDLEDLAQQVLLSLTKDLSNYDQSRARFRTWLSAVIRNAALVHFRKQKSRQERIRVFGEEQSIDSMDQPSDIDLRIEQEWAAYVANIAMTRVKEVFQGQAIQVFELGLDGLSASDIAEKTGLTISSVYTLRKRVKKRLYLEIRALVVELEPA
ncbi:sigma-70 family RNA polymerase sigma factor [Pontiellaceae bacterium B1224]|nr:sigma-70 family RNA polymerase sigma factor [Pontiellaceae bacterium B1224]